MTINTRRYYRSALLLGILSISVGSVQVIPLRERTVHFTYKAIVGHLPTGAKRADFWLPLPHTNPFQTITELIVESPYPYRIDSGQYGNRILHVSVNKPTSASFTISMRFTALRREHIQPQMTTPGPASTLKKDPDMARWLLPDRLVPIDGRVKQWAQEVVDSAGARTDQEKARAIYQHIIATVKYDKTGTGWGRGDIYYACDARRGNCTDFHAIFIGYCRAVGIPARFAIGVSLPADRPAGQVSGYHCWAEFYLNGVGWIPVDASEAAKNPAKRDYFFGAHDENRIEFSIGRDLQLYARQAEPLNYFIDPYAEVDGKPFTALTRTCTYQDVAVHRPVAGSEETEQPQSAGMACLSSTTVAVGPVGPLSAVAPVTIV